MDVLKVNEHHQSVIGGYAQLYRYQRQQYLRSVQSAINDVINSKLLEDTYTRDEVTEIVSGIQNDILNDLEAELINFVQANILMLCQLFQQAEKWHLQLNVDLSEMQNKELLESVQNIENIPAKVEKPKLTPLSINIEKTSELMRQEIFNLQEENKQLLEDVKILHDKILNMRQEYENMVQKCEEKNKMIEELQKIIEQNINSISKETNIEEKKLEAENILQNYDNVLKEQITNELEEMKQKVETAQSQLTLAEMELEKKFNSTAAYNNMKKIISKKNDQIKELRNRLLKYESLDNVENGEKK
ncbi:hypothetical protein PGB90_001249 [Kerria lacca]